MLPDMDEDQDKLQPLSCITCRRRKIRCDRRSPCNHCVKSSIDCVFPTSGRGLHHHQHDEAGRQAKKKQAELLTRLRRLEGVVEDLTDQLRKREESDVSSGGTPARGTATTQSTRSLSFASIVKGEPTPDVPLEDPEVTKLQQNIGQLVIDESGTRYVGNTFWTAFRSELHNIRKDFEEDEEEDDEFESSGASSQPNRSTRAVSEELSPDSHLFVFRPRGVLFHGQVKELHPLPSQIPFLWQTFCENIDPFLKMVHVPSLQEKIYSIKGNYHLLTPGMEALMFGIYLTAITSLSEKEVAMNFQVDRQELLAKFKTGLELALARADLLNSNDIMAFQALIMFLYSAYGVESMRFVWAMLGLALRLAVGLGLHRDGSKFPGTVSPFDTEIRRRAWWQLCFLDSRSGADEVTELTITDKMFDTQLPTNINDADIDPDMKEPPIARTGATDMTPCLARSEFWRFGTTMASSMSSFLTERGDPVAALQSQLDFADETKRRVEKQYFSDLEHAPLIHRFLHATMSSIFIKLKLIISYRQLLAHHRRQRLPADDSRRIVDMALEMLNRIDAIRTNPAFHGWTWHLRGGMGVQWHALCILLSQLCSQPWTPALDAAFDTVRQRVDAIPESAKNNTLWDPASKLMARAQKRHDRYHSHTTTPPTSNPTATTMAGLSPASAATAGFLTGGLVPASIVDWDPSMPGMLGTSTNIAPVNAAAFAAGVGLDPRASASSDGFLFGDAVTLPDLTDADMLDSAGWEQWDDMIMNMMGGTGDSPAGGGMGSFGV